VNIFASRDIWVDHCYFARSPDALIDALMDSTAVTVSNNYFEQHDKVLLRTSSFECLWDLDQQKRFQFLNRC
jgi:pectate lyase